MLCSVVKHLGSGRALKKWEKHETTSRVFPYTSFVLYRFLRALQQNRAQSRLLYLLSIEIIFPLVYYNNSNIKEVSKMENI